MADTAKDEISHDHNHDGIDRRGFLKCMAWAGTGMVWAVSGGILEPSLPAPAPVAEARARLPGPRREVVPAAVALLPAAGEQLGEQPGVA